MLLAAVALSDATRSEALPHKISSNEINKVTPECVLCSFWAQEPAEIRMDYKDL